jgi:prolyl-tRNA editing enzyme YbaK/EbsC (Cys-tRNA(Pro) deacylase)
MDRPESPAIARVRAALLRAGLAADIRHLPASARTAAEAAAALGCTVDEIAKSVVFAGHDSGRAILFVTAGGGRVDPDRARALAGEGLDRATPDFVRRVTGFAIGGVAPLGHLTPPIAFFDPRLFGFPLVWAAAGGPHHVFAATPRALCAAVGASPAAFTA